MYSYFMKVIKDKTMDWWKWSWSTTNSI